MLPKNLKSSVDGLQSICQLISEPSIRQNLILIVDGGCNYMFLVTNKVEK